MNRARLFGIFVITIIFSVSDACSEEIEIDGEIDETIWQQAISIGDFKVTSPLTFDLPGNKTEVKIVSDAKGIYVGFINHQNNNESIVSNTLRDADIDTDYNELIIDFDGQSARAFGFKVSRTGAVQDSIWNDENRESVDWDGDWQHAVEVDDEFWSSEIFIPWSIVTMTAVETSTRKVNLYFSRWHQGKNQRFSFPAIDRQQKTFMRKFHPVELIYKATSKIDIFPYLAYSQDLESGGHKQRLGIDVFWKPTASQQINLTLNPDFGQVESDDLVVNFGAVETFFSEKRPFFRENHDLFDLQGPASLRLVHTPRIGGEPDTEETPASDIIGAVRYSNIGEMFDFGFLSAFEDDTNQVLGRDYFAARLRYKHEDFKIGFLKTRTERPQLNRRSDVSVIDFQADPIDELSLSGQYFETTIKINPIEPESATNQTDTAWWISAEWEPFDETSHELTYFDFGQLLDVSDFGFIEQVNRQRWRYEGSYLWTDFEFGVADSMVRDIEWSWSFESNDNYQNQNLPSQFETELITTFESTNGIEVEFQQKQSGIDDLITRGNNPVLFPVSYDIGVAYFSPQNNRFRYKISYVTGKDFLKGELREYEFEPSFQVTENIGISMGLEWKKNKSWVIWDEENVLEEFKRKEFTVAFNLNAVFAERHELRLKVESVALDAVAINEFEADVFGNLNLNDEPPDSFVLSEFAAQVRYRYEISALSELYIVYSRGGEYEREELGLSTLSLLNKGVDRDDNENVFVKVKLHF